VADGFRPVQFRSEIVTFSWACAAVAATDTTTAAVSAAAFLIVGTLLSASG